ncbi:uncharacterized protein LOC141900354 [Tubulanus polymorphus]|uniref:uncharacterized protein LOC141900354 n=1 Tax=Tubulanus polymorphus TaxID=672921 RepID=UPI003DA20779
MMASSPKNRKLISSRQSLRINTYGDAKANLPNGHQTFGGIPSLKSMKQGIVRNQLCNGISYVLPVAKSKNSTENEYRTDLKAMFHKPYVYDRLQFDDERVCASAKLHLKAFGVLSRERKEVLELYRPNYDKIRLNSACEMARNQYTRSAPSNMRRRVAPVEMRPNSAFNHPIAPIVPKEIKRIQEEAQKALVSMPEFATETDSVDENEQIKSQSPKTNINNERSPNDSFLNTGGDRFKNGVSILKTRRPPTRYIYTKPTDTANIHNFEDVKNITAIVKPKLPDKMKSPFLSAERNGYVWDWLTEDAGVKDFDYFLKVCG